MQITGPSPTYAIHIFMDANPFVSFVASGRSPSSSQILLNSCQDIGIAIASDGKSRLFSWLSLSDPFMPMHNVLIYTYADDFT